LEEKCNFFVTHLLGNIYFDMDEGKYVSMVLVMKRLSKSEKELQDCNLVNCKIDHKLTNIHVKSCCICIK